MEVRFRVDQTISLVRYAQEIPTGRSASTPLVRNGVERVLRPCRAGVGADIERIYIPYPKARMASCPVSISHTWLWFFCCLCSARVRKPPFRRNLKRCSSLPRAVEGVCQSRAPRLLLPAVPRATGRRARPTRMERPM